MLCVDLYNKKESRSLFASSMATMSRKELILSGSAEELKSPRALKVCLRRTFFDDKTGAVGGL